MFCLMALRRTYVLFSAVIRQYRIDIASITYYANIPTVAMSDDKPLLGPKKMGNAVKTSAEDKPHPKSPLGIDDERPDSTDDSDSSSDVAGDDLSGRSSCATQTSETSLSPWKLGGSSKYQKESLRV